MKTKKLNLTPALTMALWAVWDCARSGKQSGDEDGEDGRGPLVTLTALTKRYESKFDAELHPAELEAHADKRVLERDIESGEGYYRLARFDVAKAAFEAVEKAF